MAAPAEARPHAHKPEGSGPASPPPPPGAPTEAEQRFVEQIALMMEADGLPRMAGRIYGWLLLCDPPYQSATDLARVLQASKGSVSAMTSLLIRAGLAERLGRPGDRRDYYRLRPGGMTMLMREASARLTAIRKLLEGGLALMAEKPPELRERLADFYDVIAFFEQEYPAILDRWEARRSAR
jgi:DNA-binding transcriptional regulator GbsR (MarR family)